MRHGFGFVGIARGSRRSVARCRTTGSLGRVIDLSGIGRSGSRVIFPILFSVFLMFAISPSAATWAYTVTLQSAYDAAGPAAGYTKYLLLDGGANYTGGLTIPVSEIVCIKGNGATLDLQTSTVQIQGKDTRLDIDHCVIKNGGLAPAGYTQGALNFVGSSGNVINNTFFGNTIGIRVYLTGPGAVIVMSNIIVGNSITGLLCQLANEPQVSYNDSWANGSYNYLIDCG